LLGLTCTEIFVPLFLQKLHGLGPLTAGCDPQSPRQPGSNENTNGLLRQYFPKGLDISNYSQTQLNVVARKLNERPRKTLHYETPAERFSQLVALTG